MPARGNARGVCDALTYERECRLTENAYRGTRQTGGDREANDPGLPPTSRIRDGAERGYGYDHQNGRHCIRHGVHEIRRAEIAHYPYREVERRDIHREDRVREVVKSPAPTLDGGGPNDGTNLAAGFEGRHYVLWVRHWALLPRS